ncbi:MAG: hypothetical protein BAJALOKI2v1_210031 [Promethearchaeota archaeon]|nr:MAG: hypothetical protein BAJALOKI2v1_210031 [Candidatus Lokiarchaeota archaeon]
MSKSKENAEIQKSLQKISIDLLEKGEVDIIIGYTNGTYALNTAPYIAQNVKKVKNLIWNNLCHINLAKYLPKIKNVVPIKEEVEIKVGIIAKGCVARAINHLIMENQINPENIKIIGIDCNGIINRPKILREFQNKDISEFNVENNEIIIKGKNFEKKLPFEKYLMANCKTCKVKAPPNSGNLSELVIGATNKNEIFDDRFEEINEFEKKPPAKRWEEIKEILNPCIRCYACREACPFCYCDICFVDQNMPRWFGKTTQLSEIITFHIIRALHSAGRCVGCGSCSNVCPMGIDLSLITRKLEKIAKERFNFISGMDLETTPPMMCYQMDDQQEFMLKED